MPTCKPFARRLVVALFVGEINMKESRRFLKPMIENAIEAGIIPRDSVGPEDASLELLLDVADARLAAEEVTTAYDFVSMLLLWLDVDATDVVALRGYLIGFREGMKALKRTGCKPEEYDGGVCDDNGVGMNCTYEKDGGAARNPGEKMPRGDEAEIEA